MLIQKAEWADLIDVARLACLLWPEHTLDELLEECTEELLRGNTEYFLAKEKEEAIGFAACSLRQDYVEGAETSPVGYLEGIYVIEGQRGKGVARGLLKAAETWAAERGCQEFASDCELENRESIAFHNATGFREANRIVCFTKRLRKEKE